MKTTFVSEEEGKKEAYLKQFLPFLFHFINFIVKFSWIFFSNNLHKAFQPPQTFVDNTNNLLFL